MNAYKLEISYIHHLFSFEKRNEKKLNNFLFKNLFFWFIQHLMILLFYFLQPKFDSLILFENQIQVNKYELIYYFCFINI